MNTIPQISAELRKAYEKSGYRHRELRDATGVAGQTLVNALGGKEDFKLSTLLSIADKLGLELLLVPKEAARGLAQPATPAVESMVDAVRKRLAAPGQGGSVE